jgi:hypothetical protein
VRDGEKLLTYLNSPLKVLLGLDIFPRVPKKKKKIVFPSNMKKTIKYLEFKSALPRFK